ncbi:MAG: hypothetical protein JNM94_14130 [Phycisphaerae bacterium]|nr:hypothetical protein [Phycisphaerae bacterium]
MRLLSQLFFPFMQRAEPQPQPELPLAPRGERSPPTTRRAAKPARPRRPRVRAGQAAYDAVVAEMKAAYGFKVRKWRRSMSGCAWELVYRDGRRQRMLESPYPKSPISCAIFLHEVGHHAIGLGVVRPRCLEELRAWQWSLAAMEARGLAIDDRTRVRFRRSMEYAVAKSMRRGAKSIPAELAEFLPARGG